MTPSKLKQLHEERNPDSCYFSRDTMKFFGDTMANYGVDTVTRKLFTGQICEVFRLWRKHPVKCGLTEPAYFSKDDYSRLHGVKKI